MGPLLSSLCAALTFATPYAMGSVVGKWDTPQELELTLSANGRFSMGPRAKGMTFAGVWKRSGNTIKLETTTLRGVPLKAALSQQLDEHAAGMSPKRRADYLAAQRTVWNFTFYVSPDEKTLRWRSNGQDTLFSRLRRYPIALTDAEISKGLRRGMAVHEVMDFFRTGGASLRELPADRARSISDFPITTARGPAKVRATYLRVKGKVGLERVDLLEGPRRRRIALQ